MRNKIIKYSIKFMRLLSTYIVDVGTYTNTEKRITYRGIDREALKDVKKDEIFRFIIIIIKKY